ncbi:hypothetical protein EI94DRAFT_1897646 [Lactarius quietus]|nr:hypothetical protein EI94DRAFT_1897646 [Lactarius quietus]
MRHLRVQDVKWFTCKKLTEMFGCSTVFVGYVAPLPGPEKKAVLARIEQTHKKAWVQWGEKAEIIHEICKKRKEFW